MIKVVTALVVMSVAVMAVDLPGCRESGSTPKKCEESIIAAVIAGEFKGPQGEQGIPGPIGPQGVQGLQGVQGEQGGQGVQGIQGMQGETGTAGSKGDKGDKGDTGATGNDGSNGSNGSDGSTGSAGIDGEDGTNGDDGTDGTDGEDGKDGKDAVMDSKVYDRLMSVTMAMSSVELNPDHKGLSMSIGISNYNKTAAGAIGFMYGVESKEGHDVGINVKAYGSEGGYHGFSGGFTIGF